MMGFTLKNYQQRVLARLEDFLDECRLFGPAEAYRKIAHRTDEDSKPENPYAAPGYREIEGLEDRPHVCLRVPTGGGKTYLAALSLRRAADFMETEAPTVLWFVPSDAIRGQTVDMLNSPEHSCRKALDEAFGMSAQVCDVGDFVNLRPQDFTERACVIVSTAQMFRVTETAKNPKGKMSKATRKIYATNEALEPHFAQFLPPDPPQELARDERDAIKLSFVNLLFLLRPAVILDEAHNFVSDLSKTVLQRINPSCVIEWTATPRERPGGEPLHNVLTSVGAEELRDEEMIKLPVQVTAHSDWEQAVNGAVNERKHLARLAKDRNDRVRPIVLYKAQQKNADVPVARLKQHLIEAEGVEEDTIAIATGKTKETGGIDLLAPDCRIEHIITVEALREGWDCPFAYILCPVDNMSSATAVEQLLGRVLRMPFAKQRKAAALNRAYAHVPAESFIDAVKGLREKMAAGLGFEEEEISWSVQGVLSGIGNGEYGGIQEDAILYLQSEPDFSALPEADRQVAENAVRITSEEPAGKDGSGGLTITLTAPVTKQVKGAILDAVAADKREEQELKLEILNRELMKRQSPAEKGVRFAPLTQLTFILPGTDEPVIVNSGSLYEAAEWNDLGDDCLLRDFSITESAETFEIRIKNGKVVHKKTTGYQMPVLPDKEFAMDMTMLSSWLERNIRVPGGRYLPETLKELVSKNIRALTDAGNTLEQLVRAKYVLAEALKQWLNEHVERVMEKTRQQMLFDNEDLTCEIEFSFDPKVYHPGERLYSGNHQFRKHYYGSIGEMDGSEEEECAIIIDGMNEVRHWIRNMSRKPGAFYLPLSSDKHFYPDFILELTNGKCLVVEYKGAHLWGDSELKRQIGKLWEHCSDGRNFFVMVSKRPGQPRIEQQISRKIRKILDHPS